MRKTIFVCFCLLVLSTTPIIAASAETITLISGNASIGQYDPMVSVWGNDVTIANITYQAAPVSYQQARVLIPYPDWAVIPESKWVGVIDGTTNSPTGGYTYKIEFQLPQNFSQPMLELTFTSDNFGSAYLNSNWIGSTSTGNPIGEWSHLYNYCAYNPTYFRPGNNVLYFDVMNGICQNCANPSGLLFNAKVSFTPVPEPSSIFALLSGIATTSLLFRRRITKD